MTLNPSTFQTRWARTIPRESRHEEDRPGQGVEVQGGHGRGGPPSRGFALPGTVHASGVAPPPARPPRPGGGPGGLRWDRSAPGTGPDRGPRDVHEELHQDHGDGDREDRLHPQDQGVGPPLGVGQEGPGPGKDPEPHPHEEVDPHGHQARTGRRPRWAGAGTRRRPGGPRPRPGGHRPGRRPRSRCPGPGQVDRGDRHQGTTTPGQRLQDRVGQAPSSRVRSRLPRSMDQTATMATTRTATSRRVS
jgi:hypothetical protein